MVFQTLALFARINKGKGPDELWRKRKIFKLASYFYGRRRNCYSNAVRGVLRAMAFSTWGRKLKKQDMRNLWITRVTAGSEELGVPFSVLQKGLIRSDVLLSQKSLSELAIWEPRSFKALTQLAWIKGIEDGFKGISELGNPPENVITRDLLKKEEKKEDC